MLTAPVPGVNAKLLRWRMKARMPTRTSPAQNVVRLARMEFGADYVDVFEGGQSLVVSYRSIADGGTQMSLGGASFSLSSWHDIVIDITITPSRAITLKVDGSMIGTRTDLALASTATGILKLGAATGYPCGSLDYEIDDVMVLADPQ